MSDAFLKVLKLSSEVSECKPLIPGTQYFRFNPVDERCQVELDDTEASLLQGLLAGAYTRPLLSST